jgi:transcriptional regulator with PAS, ATPase and Fis domain
MAPVARFPRTNYFRLEYRMELPDWATSFPGAITVCDAQGIIIYMNDRSARGFAKDGGRDLIGKNLLDCHPEPSRTLVQSMLALPRTNAYTIEKNGIRKLIYQAPWFVEDKFAGLVELSLEIPFNMPHYIRKP